jgi:hypothetical protein
MFCATIGVILAYFFPTTGMHNWKVANGYAKSRLRASAWGWLKVARKVTWQVTSYTDDKLTTPFLRDTEFPCVLHL